MCGDGYAHAFAARDNKDEGQMPSELGCDLAAGLYLFLMFVMCV